MHKSEVDARIDTTTPMQSAIDVSERPVLFFDGVCGLCNRTVDFLLARDAAGVFLFAPLQGETASQRLGTNDTRTLDSVVLLDGHKCYRRSSAVVRICWRLGGAWKLLAGLMWLVPLPLRNLSYRIVAKTRYRLFGKKESCRLPTPDERLRFLP